ncbi:hypothetical protein [Nitrosopumilus adriaticus]|uniref:Uncharacterized protein n=1 Tax=Nitrosopumilus adriaticus TaxID=1580092 RepID=A0A0D5C3C0_9ARCH|nr:hypothetical protein [Nitrosopumilus adriaticus]AJW71231.1 hypothetical protein NADRNF5_1550 [Nitrosopumilus adriaticus]
MNWGEKIELKFDIITYEMLKKSADNLTLSVEDLIKIVISENVFGIDLLSGKDFEEYEELPWIWQEPQKRKCNHD